MRTQEIVVLMHRPGERILDRHDTTIRGLRLHGAKQLLECAAGHQPQRCTERLECRGMAERTGFSLNGDAHHASVTAPRLLLDTWRRYLARTPDLYRGAGGVPRLRRRSKSRCDTLVLSSRRSASIVIGSPSSTRASGPPTAASGAT